MRPDLIRYANAKALTKKSTNKASGESNGDEYYVPIMAFRDRRQAKKYEYYRLTTAIKQF